MHPDDIRRTRSLQGDDGVTPPAPTPHLQGSTTPPADDQGSFNVPLYKQADRKSLHLSAHIRYAMPAKLSNHESALEPIHWSQQPLTNSSWIPDKTRYSCYSNAPEPSQEPRLIIQICCVRIVVGLPPHFPAFVIPEDVSSLTVRAPADAEGAHSHMNALPSEIHLVLSPRFLPSPILLVSSFAAISKEFIAFAYTHNTRRHHHSGASLIHPTSWLQ